MYGKAAICLSFVILFLISCSISVGTVDLRSYFFPLLQSPQVPRSLCASGPPLLVYMYDLPRKFHVGMMDRRSFEGPAPVTADNFPPWPSNSGIKKQHSVEYWLMASLLYGGNGDEDREAVRVSDPESAEAFFVPFFSSLSFNTHGHNMTDPETEVDRRLQRKENLFMLPDIILKSVSFLELTSIDYSGIDLSFQVELLEFLRKSKYYQRSGGRDHVIPMTHPNAFRFLRQELNASILIVVDFGRYPKTMSSLSKDVVAPYVHVVDSFTDDDALDPYESRTTLLFFRGNTVRKDQGKIRIKLAKILSGIDDVHYEKSVATPKNIIMSKETDLLVNTCYGEFSEITCAKFSNHAFYLYFFLWMLQCDKALLARSFGLFCSTEGMRSSKFCLHPAGDTPSSCRLFDAIVSHCVPVIVSDKIELPYEDEIDYSEFSIFFSMKEALEPGYLVNQLRQFPKDRWVEMWKQLKNISHHFEFQYPPKKEDGVNMLWRQVKRKLPRAQLAIHRSRRLKVPDWWQRRR
ncbi:putative arabinosyltransferase ARAD1 isoform X1 [Gossypium australe]|uniref:Putative arabinosyltransferase ARAD1 isoform X1 n=1 Tax=Gossypium australe TaxID=47621 RepID=A0A5B6V9R9_9ROSI|nr:putative arabinosyltransferase ARAD1 isoform X1 [Gossypium australe]